MMPTEAPEALQVVSLLGSVSMARIAANQHAGGFRVLHGALQRRSCGLRTALSPSESSVHEPARSMTAASPNSVAGA